MYPATLGAVGAASNLAIMLLGIAICHWIEASRP